MSATLVLDVPSISCDHCKGRIESVVGELPAVDSVAVDVDAKSVTILGGDRDTVVDAIEQAGYPVS